MNRCLILKKFDFDLIEIFKILFKQNLKKINIKTKIKKWLSRCIDNWLCFIDAKIFMLNKENYFFYCYNHENLIEI